MIKKVNTTTKRLIEYTIWLIGSALLICMMTTFFGWLYNHQYQKEFQQLSSFSKYLEHLDECMVNMDMYASRDESTYYETAREEYLAATEAIEAVSGLAENPRLVFEINDVICMTEYLGRQMQEVQAQMEMYLSAGKKDFANVQKAYDKMLEIHFAIMEDYQAANKMILNDAESVHENMQQKNTIFISCMVICLIAVTIILVLEIRSLSKTITLPISILTVEAEKVKNRAFDTVRVIETSKKENDEISVLVDVFNDMFKKLQEHIETMEENSRVRQELAESKFKELQAQINPHFLFNTLNMIAETAYLENADQTAGLIKCTSKMLRFSLDFSGKTVKLFQELEALDNYIMVQEQRFGERIRFEFDLDERFHDIYVPALTVQPLVENAIVHGIGMKDSGALIFIRTVYDEAEKKGIISVEDNGIGMTQNRLEEVKKEMINPAQKHVKIGLSNVFLRLHMLYEKRFDMDIYSKEGVGTRIEIALPCETEG